MPVRTRLAAAIESVSDGPEGVLDLYKQLADETFAADQKEDQAAVKLFEQYGTALYIMAVAYHPTTKKEIQDGLKTMSQKYADEQNLVSAFYAHSMQNLNWS